MAGPYDDEPLDPVSIWVFQLVECVCVCVCVCVCGVCVVRGY